METSARERSFGNPGGSFDGEVPSRIRLSRTGREIRIVDPGDELTRRPGVFERVVFQAAKDVRKEIKRFVAEKALF
ncbi:MAG: hypothetical protein Q7R53_02535 [bacterium]|nr:hypothetical protein [bacterium]